MDSAGKRRSVNMDPAHGPPLQVRVAAANGTVLAAGKLLALTRRSWRTWNGTGQANEQNGGKATERGQMMLMRAVGMAGKKWQQAHSPQNRHCRRTQPADSPSGTGLNTNGHQMAGLAAKQQLPQTMSACRAGRWGGGVQLYWQPGRRAQTYLTCPYPTYRLCLSLSLPTPLICTNPI